MYFGFIPPEVWKGFILAFKYVYTWSPVWLPVVFIISGFRAWINYRRQKFWQKEGSVLLEIKLPKEITKSPLAMETVLGAFHQGGGESTWIDRIWKGKTRARFSLEIASFGGNVKFFIWTQLKHKDNIKAQIYSQYPEVEIYEVEDYTKLFYYNPNKNNLWASEFALTKPDPYPIKTYIDYGLDKNPKEELKIDPITPMIEFLGSITEGHTVWFQIIIRAHKKRRLFDIFGTKEDSWEDDAERERKKIMEKLKVAKEEGSFPRIPSKGEAEKIAALERSISKFPFDCGIRAIYIADKDKFNPSNIGGILGSVKQYSSLNLNGFKPAGWMNDFDYPWDEWFNRKNKIRPRVLEEFKLRRYFYSPWKCKKFHGSKSFVLNVEELATIYHFPGSVASTPTFERIPSIKAKAPSNLPV